MPYVSRTLDNLDPLRGGRKSFLSKNLGQSSLGSRDDGILMNCHSVDCQRKDKKKNIRQLLPFGDQRILEALFETTNL
jgi:hypothetical protein